MNGDFAHGLTGWTARGAVVLETNHPAAGKATVRIGPGTGEIAQRIAVGGQNHLIFSARFHANPEGAGQITLRFLDAGGRELMRIDSGEMKHGSGSDTLERYMKPHPLTASVEIEISKSGSPGSVEAADVSLGVYDEDDPSLQTTEHLDDAMRPFWQGDLASKEAVLLVSHDGKPATGTLMFRPTRIISVTDYGSGVQYRDDADFMVDGRSITSLPNSRIPQIRDADLKTDDLAWNEVGGKQILVTYEHSDPWTGPIQQYVGDQLPNTLRKLAAHKPLRIVAYGDSITFGIGSSRVLRIPPFQPPWIELFVRQLAQAWNDPAIVLYNSAQSGADSEWAKQMAGRMVASLSPDLVVIAFGQNDFWRISRGDFDTNIASVIASVRAVNPQAEFLLVSTMRFDPAYTDNRSYWKLVGEYDAALRALTGTGVQLVDFTAISGAVFAAKEPKDCLNDPLHPNDYLSRLYAQSAAAALTPPAALGP